MSFPFRAAAVAVALWMCATPAVAADPEAFFDAVWRGEREAVERLLDDGTPVDLAMEEFGLQALHVAAAGGHVRLAKGLLRRGADQEAEVVVELDVHPAKGPRDAPGVACRAFEPEGMEGRSLIPCLRTVRDRASFVADLQGVRPLHMAARYGQLEMVQLLVGRGASLSPSTALDQTPLHAAVLGDHQGVVAFLAAKGADLSAGDLNGSTPIERAAGNGTQRSLEVLVDAGPVDLQGEAGSQLLEIAGRAGHRELAGWLRDQGATYDASGEEGSSKLLYAIDQKAFEAVRFLVEQGAEVNRSFRDETPLQVSVRRGGDGIVDYLLEQGAIVPVDGDGRMLFDAARRGDKAMVKQLEARGLSYAADTDQGHEDLLYEAGQGPLFAVRFLVERGADPNHADGGDAALHLAAQHGKLETVRYLLEQGASVQARNGEGETPLHKAIWSRDEALLKVLLAAGADPEAEDSDGLTPRKRAEKAGLDVAIAVLDAWP